MEIFNNREIAIIIWLPVFALWMVAKTDIRNSFGGLVKQFFHYKILIPYLLAVSYTFIGVYILFKIGAWKTEQFKDTILWSVFTILSILLNINKARQNKEFFKDVKASLS